MPRKPKYASCTMPLAHKAYIQNQSLHVHLRNGDKLELPIHWFPLLKIAPKPARDRIRIMGPGIGLRWPDLGYELGVEGLTKQRRALKW